MFILTLTKVLPTFISPLFRSDIQQIGGRLVGLKITICHPPLWHNQRDRGPRLWRLLKVKREYSILVMFNVWT